MMITFIRPIDMKQNCTECGVEEPPGTLMMVINYDRWVHPRCVQPTEIDADARSWAYSHVPEILPYLRERGLA